MKAILEILSTEGKVLGFDRDADALSAAGERLSEFKGRFELIHSGFGDISDVLSRKSVAKVDGLLLDLGVSSYQIDTATRGFSFDQNGLLDMRMDQRQELQAQEILNSWPEVRIADTIREFGEERNARKIARHLVKERERKQLQTTSQLRDIVASVTPFQHRAKTLARVFQALRIVVNNELDELDRALKASVTHLSRGGRVVVISYHSLEDRMVKQFFRQQASRCTCAPEAPICICGKKNTMRILTKRPVRASEEESASNPRSRSAKLRAAEII
jgi:16S rRNA (cytosine1402-N4)-methyltransferase